MAGDLGDTLGAGRGGRRDDPAPPPRRPPDPTAEQRERWAQPGYDRFQDSEHQRWAQGHRSVEFMWNVKPRSAEASIDTKAILSFDRLAAP